MPIVILAPLHDLPGLDPSRQLLSGFEAFLLPLLSKIAAMHLLSSALPM
jgi:hypothetical protein